jgi:pSer/pThr/pTyr-binding forkhead associated (FHA) protein
VTILIPGNDKPSIFRNKERLVIGRRDDMLNFFPEVDLTDHYGVLMGVSRKHAEITLKNGQCFIQDLSSSNGTWLNEVMMVGGNTYPLKNGDQVRLGKLLLLIYLSSSQDADSSAAMPTADVRDVMTVHFADKSETSRLIADGMTPSYLADTLGVYLRAIAALQRTVRQAQEQSAPPVVIRRIQMDEAKHTIQVDILNANDIINFLHDTLPVIVIEKQQAFMKSRSAQSEIPTTAGWLTDAVFTDVADRMLSELVFKFLQDKRVGYLERLSKILIPVLKSQLRIIRVIQAS